MRHVHRTHWGHAPILRVLFAVAGTLVATSVLLGLYVHSGFVWFAVFVGGMQIFFALTGWCPMAILLQLFGMNCSLKKKE